MGEWTIRKSLGQLTLNEQREIRDVPVLSLRGLYAATSGWWELLEVTCGVAARVPQWMELQGGQLMGEPLMSPWHLMLAPLWAVEVADVFLGSMRHHGHLRHLPLALQ